MSGLKNAQDKYNDALCTLRNTDSFVGVIKGGSMATRTIAQNALSIAARNLNYTQASFNIAKIGVSLVYKISQFALKQGIILLIGG